MTGGSFPAQIWHDFAEVALADVPAEEFAAPPDELLAAPEVNARSRCRRRPATLACR